MKSKLAAPLSLTFTMACGAAPELDAPEADTGGESQAQGYLGYTTDQCSGPLKGLHKNGQLVTIPRGVSTRVDVGIYRFRWFCGSSAEATTCNVGTRYVTVLHSANSRQITWGCYY